MNYIPEVLFSSIVYLVQIVSLVGIALGLSRIFSLIVKTKHSKARFVIIASIIFVMIAATTANPIIICPNEYKKSFTQEKREVAEDIASGLYSTRVPLFPLWAKIENIKHDGSGIISVHYGFIPCVTVHSFCDEGTLEIIRD